MAQRAHLIPTGDEADRSAARKDFFSEEKKQKTLPIVTRVAATRTYESQKFFGSFFKKELLSFSSGGTLASHWD